MARHNKNTFDQLFDIEYDVYRDPKYLINLLSVPNNSQRIPLQHYQTRIEVNSAFQQALIPKIMATFGTLFTAEELRSLNPEDLLEVAGASVNKSITLTLEKGRDCSDGSDFKTTSSMARNNCVQERYTKNHKLAGQLTGYSAWTNSYKVSGVKDKTGTLRVMGYNKHLKRFDYWAIPHRAYKGLDLVELPIERYKLPMGEAAQFTGRTNYGHSKWDEFRCDSLEECCIKLPS